MTATGNKLRLGIVFGGRSEEHDASLASAASIIDYLDGQKYEVIPIGITRSGRWLVGTTPADLQALQADLLEDTPQMPACLISGETIETLEQRLDVIFPVLHGVYGEDGTVQGLLEMLNKPYVGCGVLGSALGMDKDKMKWMLRAHGLETVKYQTYRYGCQESLPDELIRSVERTLGYPCFVKPSNGGSSIGISKVHKRDELLPAFQLAARYDTRIIIEQAIEVRELACAVLGNNVPVASVIGEVIVHEHDFYDFTAKYLDHSTETNVPANIPRLLATKMRDLAIQAFHALNLSGMARVDFFLDKQSERLFINEVNTWPSFTRMCLYPRLCAESGLPYPLLLERLIDLALERHLERQLKRTSPLNLSLSTGLSGLPV